uniref:General vesicular transport factor p115 n=1 Tax=Nothobranchius furzeri TaxID=105023 RepID=A0A1A8B2L1_NOTFU
MNFFRGVITGQATGPQPTGAETIQKLCDRVASSTLLEDRRDAVRALKSLSKKYRMEVGTQAMDHLINILQTDRSDSEILGYALDTLYNIICNDEEEEQDESEDENAQKQTDDLGAQFTEKFIQDPEHITLLLTLLEEFDFHVRWPGVKLLTALLKNQGVQVQGIVLVSPMGVSRLMDLLADSREVIRNDGLLLLQQLTKGNAAIQKITKSEKGSKVQTRVGLLMLLCTWISNCPIAVTHFLHNQDNVPFLTAQISENLGEDERLVQGLCALLLGICIYYNDNSLENYTKEKLKQLIEKRIGKENFVEKLGFITKHELYSRAALKPQPIFPSPEQMLFDHEFTKLVKELEGVITKAVHKSSEEDKKEEEVKKTLEQHDNIVTQYKELIREQDAQIQELKEQVASMTTQTDQMQATISQQLSQIQQHKDQYNILKLKLGKDSQSQPSTQADGSQVNGLQTEELSQLREELEELRKQHTLLQTQVGDKDALIDSLKSAAQTSESSGGGSANTELLQELEALKSQVQSQLADINQLKTERQELLRRAEAGAADAAPSSDGTSDAIKELESRLSAQMSETERLKESQAGLEQQLASATSTVAILQTEKSKLQSELQESKKEQDDLLMLLADQDQKIHGLKQRLKDLGEPVEDEDDIDAREQTSDEEDEDED